MKKILYVLSLCGVLILSGCNSSTGDDNNKGDVVSYTVTFNANGGSSVESQKIENGKSISKPTDPTYEGFIFDGWYSDSSLTNEVTFPLTITADTTIYAKWTEIREYYLNARDSTVGDNSLGFVYDSNLSVDVGYAALSQTINGKYVGKARYNKGAAVSYYENIDYTGLLFDDHTTHEYLESSNLSTIKVQKEGTVSSYNKKTVETTYKYDYSSFAKSLFTYKKEDIKKVVAAGNGKYEIFSTAGFTSIAKTILNNINNPLVEKVFGALPETSSTYHNYVTFSNGYIDTYTYSFNVDVEGITLSVSYNLDFTSTNKAESITLPTFDNLIIDETLVKSNLTKFKTDYTNYKAKEYSSYDFTVKTGVNYAKKNEINATISGKAQRNVGTQLFFKDEFEIDTDLKNNDLYGATNTNVVDYNGAIAKISDGTIYHVVNPTIGFKKYTEFTASETNMDYLYLHDGSILAYPGINCIEKTISDTKTNYSLGVSNQNAFAADMLNLVNDSTYIDKTIATQPKIVGTFLEDSIVTNNCSFTMVYESDLFTTIKIDVDGVFATKFEGSRDFTVSDSADFSVSIELKTTSLSYSAPSDKKDIL
jgi:uncharacterized repeat protein (TIGR02543 family)